MFRAKSTLIPFLLLGHITYSRSAPEGRKSGCNGSGNNLYILPGTDINHFYLECENAYIVHNKIINYYLTVNDKSRTLTIVDNTNGFGYLINLDTQMCHIITQDLKTFDLSQAENGNYQNLSAIYDYSAQYISYATGVNATSPLLANSSKIIKDCAMSTDPSTWAEFIDKPDLAKLANTNFHTMINGVHDIFETTDYKWEELYSIHAMYVANYYGAKDATAELLADFPIYLSKDRRGVVDKEVVVEFKRLINDEDINTATKQFDKLKKATNGLGTTYATISDAMEAYKKM